MYVYIMYVYIYVYIVGTPPLKSNAAPTNLIVVHILTPVVLFVCYACMHVCASAYP